MTLINRQIIEGRSSFKRTKPISLSEYPTALLLMSDVDRIRTHTQREQEMGGFTGNETWDRSTWAREYAKDGREFLKAKLSYKG